MADVVSSSLVHMPYGIPSEADRPCSEDDLRFIGVKLADHGISTSVISRNLQVSLDTSEATTCPATHCDEICKLLLIWKRNTPATRKVLLDFLHKLNNPSLLGEVEKYFGQSAAPSLFAHDQHQESGSVQDDSLTAHDTAHEVIPVSGAHHPFAGENRPILVGPNICNVTGSHRTCRELVETPVNPHTRDRFEVLKHQFSCLVEDIQDALDDTPIARLVDKLHTFLSSQLASFGSTAHCQVPVVSSKSLRSQTTVAEIFVHLNEIRAWDFLNIRLLELVMKRFGKDLTDLQKRLEQHKEDIYSFKQQTLFADFLDIWYEQLHVANPDQLLQKGFTRLKTKFNIPWKNLTVADFAKHQGYLCGQFLLQEHIFRFAMANEGCVTALWLVPKALEEYMIEIYQERMPDLAQGGIVEIAVGNTLIYKADTEEPVSRMITHYDEYYKYSIEHPKEFWGKMAARTLVWEEPFDRDKVMEGCDMTEGRIKFFDGKLNASVNCLDRHVRAQPNKVAIIWEKNINEGENPEEERITYRQLLEDTCRIANVLKKHNVKKGDSVIIYMPAMPLAVASMLACSRIGAVHNVVFSVLKTEDLKRRVVDSDAKVIITADEAIFGRNFFCLKSFVDEAISQIVSEKNENAINQSEERMPATESDYIVFVARRTGKEVVFFDNRDFSLEMEMKSVESECPPVFVDGEDPLFILYTSGSSDSPLGIVHSTAGYLLQVALTHKYVFDYKPGDVFGCMADLGWITGHSYVVYGPLCNGATTVLFEGTPNYPACDRYWEMIDRLGINQFYITPSTIRYLMKDPENLIDNYKDSLTSLRTIATAGEPLNTSAWEWYYEKVGHERCTLLDTWWQTETGAISIVVRHNMPKSGQYSHSNSAFPPKPFFGVEPCIIDTETGKELAESEKEKTGQKKLGYLCLKKPLPSMGRKTLPSNMYSNYFNFNIEGSENVSDGLKGKYFTFDKAIHIEGGGYKITCRVGDVIRMKDAWLDIPEIEGSMNKCDERILEASLVKITPSTNKRFSQTMSTNASTAVIVGTCAFVELAPSVDSEEFPELIDKLKTASKEALDVPDCAVPRMFIFLSDQLMTHSGKIARSLMREIIDLTQKISSLCSPRKKNAEEYTKGEFSFLNVHIWYRKTSWKHALYD